MQDLSDQHYAVVIGALQLTFSFGDRAGGLVLEHARRAMFNLHEVNHFLAAQAIRPRFRLPSAAAVPPPVAAPEAHAFVDSLAAAVSSAASAVTASGGGPERTLAGDLERRNEELVAGLHRLIDDLPP